MRVYPYKIGSKSARALAAELGCGRVRRRLGKFRNNYNHVIVNWGSGAYPEFWKPGMIILNKPEQVEVAGNKLATFRVLDGKARIPEFTTYKEVAREWVEEGGVIVARKLLRGHSGHGIHIISSVEEMVEAPLYTRYVKKANEYRVHIFKGEVIDVQQKRKRHEIDREDVNFQVRNLEGGWVFCRDDVNAPDDVKVQSQRAVEALGLDFGAVDVGFNNYKGEATVFEVNTACGLEGTTVERYAHSIKEYINGIPGR